MKNRVLKSSEFIETLKHSWTYFTGKLAVKGLSLISLPIMTRLLSPDDYGVLSIVSTYSTMAITVLALNMNVGIGRYYHEKRKDFSEFFGTAFAVPSLLILTQFFLAFLFIEEIAQLVSLPSKAVMFVFVLSFFGLIKNVHLEYFRAARESKKIRSLNILTGYLGFALAVVFVYFHPEEERFMGSLWAMLLTGIISTCIVLVRIGSKMVFNFKWDHLKYMLSYGLPLMPSYLSGIILSQFDRVMLGSYLGNSDAGQYSFAYNISMLLTMVMNALYYSWEPKYYEYMNSQDYESHDMDTYRLLGLLSVFTCFLILFADWIGYILGSHAFHESLYLIPIIVLGQFMLVLTPIYKRHISFVRKTIYTALATMVAGICNVFLNSWLIPVYGSVAAGYTTLASYTIMFILIFLIAKYWIRVHVTPLNRIIDKVLVVFSACVFYYFDHYLLELNTFFSILAKFAMFVLFMAIIYRSRLKMVVLKL